MKQWIGLLVLGVAAPVPARASTEGNTDPPVSPAQPAAYYVASLVGTTVAVRPTMGPVNGPQKDLTTGLGLGRSIGSSLFAELDVCGTFAEGDAPMLSLVPGVGWSFDPNVYAALRAVVPLDLHTDVSLAPGLGAMYMLDDRISIFGELNLLGTVRVGAPDFGVAVTVGATVQIVRTP